MSSFFAWHLRRNLAAVAFTTSALLAACADNVIVTTGGTTSGGTSSTTIGTSTGGDTGGSGGVGGDGGAGGSPNTGGGTPGCDDLGAILESAISNALACNPVLSVPQCSGKTVVKDSCGCELAANDMNQSAAGAALSTYSTWTAYGCGPIPCFQCPPSPSSKQWFCDPTTKQCNVEF